MTTGRPRAVFLNMCRIQVALPEGADGARDSVGPEDSCSEGPLVQAEFGQLLTIGSVELEFDGGPDDVGLRYGVDVDDELKVGAFLVDEIDRVKRAIPATLNAKPPDQRQAFGHRVAEGSVLEAIRVVAAHLVAVEPVGADVVVIGSVAAFGTVDGPERNAAVSCPGFQMPCWVGIKRIVSPAKARPLVSAWVKSPFRWPVADRANRKLRV